MLLDNDVHIGVSYSVAVNVYAGVGQISGIDRNCNVMSQCELQGNLHFSIFSMFHTLSRSI